MCHLNILVSLCFLSASCGRPYNNQLNNGAESVDKGDRVPHPGKQHSVSASARLKVFIPISQICEEEGDSERFLAAAYF